MIQMATITVSDLSTELGTDARTARKFLRSITPADAQPGKGGRWSIEKREVRSMKSKFSKWVAEVDEKRASRETPADAPTQGDDAEPTDAELDALAAELELDA